MPQNVSVQSLLAKFSAEEESLTGRVSALRDELAGLEPRLNEVRLIRQALEAQTGPPSKPASGTKQSTSKANKRTSTTVKWKTTSKKTGIHVLPIVEAAIALANEKQVEVADAGAVLGWFAEIGYETRGKLPTRNTVGVMLGNEVKRGEKTGTVRISRPDRGQFRFHAMEVG